MKLRFFSDNISKRTLQRDLNEICNEFCLEIQYSKVNKGYFISDDEGASDIKMMLEPLNLLGAFLWIKNCPSSYLPKKENLKEWNIWRR
jgi:predicted DNA-binding transcriptional regulator YafY